MDELMSWVGLAGLLLMSLGLTVEGLQKGKSVVKRVGGLLFLASVACFLVVIVGKLLGKL